MRLSRENGGSSKCMGPPTFPSPPPQAEGHERRYFYGAAWAVIIAHPVLLLMWKLLPATPVLDTVKLAVFVGILAIVGQMSRLGMLPRTRPIVPGEWAVSD